MSDMKASPPMIHEPYNLARRAAQISLVISSLGVLWGAVLVFRLPHWNSLGFLLVGVTVWLSSLLSSRFAKSRAKMALILVIFSVLFTGLTISLLFQNSATLYFLVVLSGLIFIPPSYFSPRGFYQLWMFMGSVFLLSWLIDRWGVSSRPVVLDPFTEIIVAALLLLVFIALVLRRFTVSSLRYKVVVSFLVISLFLVLVIGGYSVLTTRSLLVEAGYPSLASAAEQTRSKLDQFVTYQWQILSAQAESDVYQDYLRLPKAAPTSQEIQSVRAALRAMIDENAPDDEGWFSFLKGYVLLNSAGEIAEAALSSPVEGLSLEPGAPFGLIAPEDSRRVQALFPETGSAVLWIGMPVQDPDHRILGQIAAIYDFHVIQKLVQEANGLAGARSYAWVLDENGLLLAQGIAWGDAYSQILPLDANRLSQLQQMKQMPPGGRFDQDIAPSELVEGIEAVLGAGNSSFSFYWGIPKDPGRVMASGTVMKTVPWVVLYLQRERNFLAPLETQIRMISMLAGLLALAVILAALGLAQRLTAPVLALTRIASAIAEGNLSIRATTSEQDEIGILAKMLNTMIAQMQRSLFEMEERIKQRTFELERRSRQLQLAADVGRAAATIHDLDELLERVAVLISERFDLYHVGVFLIDEAGEYAVLRAANSEGGRRLLENGYRLAIGHQGVVGMVAATGQAQIISNLNDIAGSLQTDFPDTRSEMTLPLVSAGGLLGVLDVHSMKPGAFTADDLAVMQVLADLIAVAIENARLIAEGQYALEATRRAYGEISHEAWLERLRGQEGLVFRSQSRSTFRVNAQDATQKSQYPQQISIPIRVRDTIIGYIDTYKPLERGYWTSEEEEILYYLADQIGIALESARLYESSQAQAERERLVSEVNARLQQTLDVDAVLKTAAAEIRQVLALEEVAIWLNDEVAPLSELAERDAHA